MDELLHLPASLQTQVLRVLESALHVRHRGEFFLWAQGQLQSLVPHGLMIGMTFNVAGEQTHCECLQAVPLEPGLLAQLQEPTQGLLGQLARNCQSSGCAALALPLPEQETATASAELLAFDAQWLQYKLGPAQFVTTGDLGVGEWAFFALMSQPDEGDATRHLLLRILMPQLLVLLWRSRQYAMQEGGQPSQVVLNDLGLTGRQLEILHWVKLGKTNNEIAQIVEISELTVKNHLQKVFKRLNVHNRAQAVAKLMSLGND